MGHGILQAGRWSHKIKWGNTSGGTKNQNNNTAKIKWNKTVRLCPCNFMNIWLGAFVVKIMRYRKAAQADVERSMRVCVFFVGCVYNQIGDSWFSMDIYFITNQSIRNRLISNREHLRIWKYYFETFFTQWTIDLYKKPNTMQSTLISVLHQLHSR